MKFRSYAMLAIVTTMGLVACSSDPTDAGSGSPAAIETTRSIVSATKGHGFTVTAFAIDQNAQRMSGALTASSASSLVVVDSAVYVHDLLQTVIYLHGTAATPAAGAIVTVSGHDLTKDVTVKIS